MIAFIPLWAFDPLFWIRLLVPLAAIYLLVRGWRGRIEGTEPYCRRCDYNLTGLASLRCPECGNELKPASVRHGRRRRRWRALAAGVAFFLVSIAMTGDFLRRKAAQMNWQNYRPFESVLTEAENGGTEALNELERRVRWQLMTPAELDRLYAASMKRLSTIPGPLNTGPWFGLFQRLLVLRPESAEEFAVTTDLAITQMTQRGGFSYRNGWPRFLESRLDERKLTEAQLRRLGEALLTPMGAGSYYGDPTVLRLLSKLAATATLGPEDMQAFLQRCVAPPGLQVRSRVTSGDCLRVTLYLPPPTRELPHTRCRLAWRALTINGERLRLPEPNSAQAPWGDHGFNDCLTIPPLEPGQYEVRCRIRYACYQECVSLPPQGSKFEIEVTAYTEVLPHDQSDLTLVDDPALTEVFEQAFLVRREPERDSTRMATLICEWSADLPASAAFEAIVRAGDRETKAGTIVCVRGRRGMQPVMFPRSLLRRSGDGAVMLILRANPELARETTHMFEAWTGELAFGPFRLEGR